MLNMKIDGMNYANSFKYSNTATELSITYNQGAFYDYSTKVNYAINWKKDKVTLSYSGTLNTTGWENINITLSKK